MLRLLLMTSDDDNDDDSAADVAQVFLCVLLCFTVWFLSLSSRPTTSDLSTTSDDTSGFLLFFLLPFLLADSFSLSTVTVADADDLLRLTLRLASSSVREDSDFLARPAVDLRFRRLTPVLLTF